MFTGIVTHRGALEAAEAAEDGQAIMRLRIRPDTSMEGLSLGDSVAVDGVCLTVTALEEGLLSFDAIPETLRKTTLGERAPGSILNLERALSAGDALGGHWVQGHVDGIGTIRAVERRGEDVRMVIAVDDELFTGMLAKGSVTLDGVSMTVGEVWREGDQGFFCVYLIPHTLEVTGLGKCQAGDHLNIEADILGRWVQHHLERIQGA
jgi:riboflavin synthase alpha subunit